MFDEDVKLEAPEGPDFNETTTSNSAMYVWSFNAKKQGDLQKQIRKSARQK